MLSQRHRFHGLNSLRNVYTRGRNVRGQLANLKYLTRDPTKPYRVAVVVSRKVHRSAVKRNRIRRRVYESVRRQESRIPAGTDLVFTVYSDQVATIDSAKLETTIAKLLAVL